MRWRPPGSNRLRGKKREDRIPCHRPDCLSAVPPKSVFQDKVRAPLSNEMVTSALQISRELISRKLAGQEDVARHKLLDTLTADAIAQIRGELPSADSISTIRLIESQAARVYWSAWSTLPINFPKNQLLRVPAHWLSFGARVSPLTGSPRLACNPPNSILNYLYSLLEAEARSAKSKSSPFLW